MTRRALVLSGGSIKGAFQAGAVASVLEAGYRPDIITGISVGALNGGFLVSRAGRAIRAGAGRIDWRSVGWDLVDFWRDRVTGPQAIVERRGALDLGWRFIRKRWEGLIDTSPLYRLVRSTLAPEDFVENPVASAFGAVSLETGQVIYAGTDDPQVIEFIFASTQAPVMMPLYRIGDQAFYDGGLRDIAPLKRAIELGAEEIVCVACQPAAVEPLPAGFGLGDPVALIGRVLEIVTNELLNCDLEAVATTNRLLIELGPKLSVLRGKRVIPLFVVRPNGKLAVEITKFGPAEVAGMVEAGLTRGAERLVEAVNDADDPGHAIAVELLGTDRPPKRVRPAA